MANIYYVASTGNDVYGDGSLSNPWRTLKHALGEVPANEGHTINLGSGTFIESGALEVPPGVNIEGAGKNSTIIKAASSFHYYPETPGYATEKFLLILDAVSETNGNQKLRNFTIDGDLKKLHGGIYIRHRNHVIVDAVSVRNTNFNGIWLWDVKYSTIRNTDLINCSWGSTGYCVGALNLGNIEDVEIDGLNINESVGYGIKAIGPSGYNHIVNLKIHDCHVSVNPYGLWENGKAPNIAIELWQATLVGCEIYDSYVDNTISVVHSESPPSNGIQTIRVHHNTIDMETRAKGAGYGIELSVHDAEIDHNYFIKGSYGIANWDDARMNWNIHHNTFYGLEGVYPGDILRSERSGLHNVNFYNNTIEFTGEKTMNVIGLYGGESEHVNVINNLIINNNTGYSYYPNALIHTEKGAVINNLIVKNNFLDSLSSGGVPGTYSDNLKGNPKIYKEGQRPNPYYQPTPKSPLLDAGFDGSPAVPGSTDDIGAFEYQESLFNEPPKVGISSPQNNSTYYHGSPVKITANASDSSGTIQHIQFFNGTTKLGEAISSPYIFTPPDLPQGTCSITAVATDSYGATDTSEVINIHIIPWTKITLYAPDADLSGYMTLTTDSTASGTGYFSIPSGYGTNYTLGASAAQFNFEVDATDNYTAWVRVRTGGVDHEGYYIYDGKGNWTTWMAGLHENWTWTNIRDAYTNNIATFPFTKGPNLLVFSWLHDNVHVDQTIITNNPDFTPITKSGSGGARSNTSMRPNTVMEPGDDETTTGIVLYPNPATNNFTITYESPVAQEAAVKITSLTSVVVKHITVQLTPGSNTIKVASDNLTNGIYFVSFATSTGETFNIKASVAR